VSKFMDTLTELRDLLSDVDFDDLDEELYGEKSSVVALQARVKELEEALAFIDKMLQQAGNTDFYVCEAKEVSKKHHKPTEVSK